MNYYTQILKQASAEYKETERIKAQHQRNMCRLLNQAKDYIEKAHYFFLRKLEAQRIVDSWVYTGVICWLSETVTRQSLNLPVWYEGRLHEGSWVQFLLLHGSLVSTPKSLEYLKRSILGKYQTGQQAIPEIEARFEPWEEWIEVVVEIVPSEVICSQVWKNKEVRPGVWRKVRRVSFYQDLPKYRLRLTLKKAPIFKASRKRR